MILDLSMGIGFHAVVVFCLVKVFLFKPILVFFITVLKIQTGKIYFSKNYVYIGKLVQSDREMFFKTDYGIFIYLFINLT